VSKLRTTACASPPRSSTTRSTSGWISAASSDAVPRVATADSGSPARRTPGSVDTSRNPGASEGPCAPAFSWLSAPSTRLPAVQFVRPPPLPSLRHATGWTRVSEDCPSGPKATRAPAGRLTYLSPLHALSPVQDGRRFVFYGMADSRIGVAELERA
jgi:hypothetical protein